MENINEAVNSTMTMNTNDNNMEEKKMNEVQYSSQEEHDMAMYLELEENSKIDIDKLTYPSKFYDKVGSMAGKKYKEKTNGVKKVKVNISEYAYHVNRDTYKYEEDSHETCNTNGIHNEWAARYDGRHALEPDEFSAYETYVVRIQRDIPVWKFYMAKNAIADAKYDGSWYKMDDNEQNILKSMGTQIVLTDEGRQLIDEHPMDDMYALLKYPDDTKVYFDKIKIKVSDMIDILEKFVEEPLQKTNEDDETFKRRIKSYENTLAYLDKLKNEYDENDIIDRSFYRPYKSNEKNGDSNARWTILRLINLVRNFRNEQNDNNKSTYASMQYRQNYLHELVDKINQLNEHSVLYRAAYYYATLPNEKIKEGEELALNLETFCALFKDIIPGIIKENMKNMETPVEETVEDNSTELDWDSYMAACMPTIEDNTDNEDAPF